MKRGFSLVELMIALLIGSVLMGGVLSVLFTAQKGFRIQDELARTQENARFAAEFIARDLRQAGFRGCRPGLTINAATHNPTDWRWNLARPIQGYQGVANFPSEFNATAAVPAYSNARHDPDALVIVRANPDAALGIAGEAQGQLTLASTHAFTEGQILLAANCTQGATFQVSEDTSGTVELRHGVVSGMTPGNCIGYLGSTDCVATDLAGLDRGGEVMPLLARGYYIAAGLGGVPGLYRVEGGLNGAVMRNELVPGVESMVLWFGHDSDADGVANRFYRAGDPALSFDDVVSVRVQLLLRTLEAPDGEVKPYTFAGATFTPTDGHVRRSFTATINLRNRS